MAIEPIKPTKEPIKTGRVFNPTSEDLHFMWDSAAYVLKAGELNDRWPVHLALHAAKKLADKNVMTTNPEEHRVLAGAYIENSDVEVIANRLGVNLDKIRKEAVTKEKEKARIVNLEAQVMEMSKKLNELTSKKEEVKEVKEVKKVAKKSKKK